VTNCESLTFPEILGRADLDPPVTAAEETAESVNAHISTPSVAAVLRIIFVIGYRLHGK
jgi:hypothetical protein